MKLFERAAYNLLDQIQKAEIVIKPLGDSQTEQLEDEIALKINAGEELRPFWHFEMRFNQDFTVVSNEIPDRHFKYENHLSKLKNEFYRDISQDIDELPIKESLNILTDYQVRFKECTSYFYPTKRKFKTTHSKTTIVTYNHKKIHKVLDSKKDMQINDILEELSIDSFVSAQKECLDQIITFLDSKKQTIELVIDQESKTSNKPSKGNNNHTPIEKLDKYQSALLFHYLKHAGATYDHLSYNKLAPLIHQLTGHSQNNLRTECLNQIQEIKMGDVGNKLELIKNKAYNLEQVKVVLRDMINELERDLKNNRDSQKK